jgi:chromosome segregation ATPase
MRTYPSISRSWPVLAVLLLACGCITGKSQAPASDASHTATNSSTLGLGLPPEIDAHLPAHAMEMERRLNSMEEERKSFVLRLQQLELALEDKDRAILQASQEVQASNAEVVRARAELEQWKKEMAGFREKVRTSEKENAAALQTMLGLLEQAVQDDKSDGKEPVSTSKASPK